MSLGGHGRVPLEGSTPAVASDGGGFVSLGAHDHRHRRARRGRRRPPPEPIDASTVGGRPIVALFVATSFLGSSLLFLVQPMVAKMLLPSLGGTPSVWNTSMVFFQTALVAGYALPTRGDGC